MSAGREARAENGSLTRAVYGVATAWLVVELVVGGAEDLLRGRSMFFVLGDPVDVVVASLGYPVYVLLFLGVLKIAGGVVIALPGLPRLKEWAYAGTFFQIALAAASQALVGTDRVNLIYPIAVIIVTLASWSLRPRDRMLAA